MLGLFQPRFPHIHTALSLVKETLQRQDECRLTLSLSTTGVSVCQVTPVTTAAKIRMTAGITAVRTGLNVWMRSTATPASVLRATGEPLGPHCEQCPCLRWDWLRRVTVPFWELSAGGLGVTPPVPCKRGRVKQPLRTWA